MFDDLQLNDRLLKALDQLGFEKATDVQRAAIPPAMEGKDLLVSAQTGSGKSAAFLLPILHQFTENPAPKSGTRALILVPTRELAEQVMKTTQDLAAFTRINALSVCGGENYQNQAAKIRKNPEIIVGTPGRIKEHLERNNIDFDDLEVLILDEADRMLDMGFKDDVTFITDSCRKERQTLMFSATLHHAGVDNLVGRTLNDPVSINLTLDDEAKPDIEQFVILASDSAFKERQLQWLLENETFDKAIVFFNTRNMTEEVGARLQAKGIRSGVLHGEMDQPERRRIMNLMRDGRINVLFATDVAARGLDIDGITLVINFDLAHSGDEYTHRIGRTGRAGQSGIAISLVSQREWNLKASIERYLGVRLTVRTLPGLTSSYTGPKKMKNSGKAAGNKKKKPDTKKTEKSKVKKRARDQKDIGKRRKPVTDTNIRSDGFAQLKKR